MVPPPVTPSPHRFLTSKPANSTTKPSSSFRFQQTPSQPTSSQQFTTAPKFNFGSARKPAIPNDTVVTQQASHLSARPRPPGATLQKPREEIEETSDNEATGALEDDGPAFALHPQPTLKRRRPNTPEAVNISSDSPSSSPPPTTPPYPSVEEDDHESALCNDSNPPARPRFILPTPKPTGTPSVPSRPPLIIPPRSPSPPPVAPTFFSPHRRGQKYVPGGLASTVRDWIVETSQQAHNQAHARRGEEESWDMRFRVGDYRIQDPNENMILVLARSEVKRWLLVGTGRGDTRVELGCLMGIREPIWEVLIGNDSYTVAIEWKVLDG